MQTAMEEQAAAERKRRATVTTAEGDKTAAILQAEGRFEASKRDASAKIVLAEASQKAIEKVTSAIGANDLPVVYLLGEKYVEAMKGISSSSNSKIVLLPGDLPAAIRGLLGTLK
jgi:regulator of protease activity HflC (stomatin/prohibitin superfamily)